MSDGAIAAAEFREVSEGRLTRNRLNFPLGPLFEGEALRRYCWFKEVYQDKKTPDDPPTFEDTKLCQRMVGRHASAEAARAVRRGDVPVLSYLTGITQRSVDSGEMDVLVRLLDGLRRQGFLQVFAGDTDDGKTNTALFEAVDLAMVDSPDMHLVTNITSVRGDVPDERLHIVEEFSEFEQALETLHDLGVPVIAVLDEFSSHASGYGGDRQSVEDHMRMLVRKAAKLGVRLIILGHDGKDIHPTIREMANYFVFQERLKDADGDDEFRAWFYDSVEDREGQDLQFRLDRVPETSVNYNPDEFTDWSWE